MSRLWNLILDSEGLALVLVFIVIFAIIAIGASL